MAVDVIGLFDTLAGESEPLHLPVGGTYYKFVWTDDLRKDDWKADGYRWRNQGSEKPIKKYASVGMRKTFFHVYDKAKSWTGEFTRSTYARPDRPNEVVVVYEGNAERAGQFPHGNNRGARIYVRAPPHLVRATRRRRPSHSVQKLCNNVALTSSGVLPEFSAPELPSITKQVRNTTKAKKGVRRLTSEELYNLMEFARDSEFVRRIVAFPNLEMIMAHPDTIETFRSLLGRCDSGELPSLQMTYSTALCLGNFSLSVLLFGEIEFDPVPVIPLAYFVREKKLTTGHDDFFGQIKILVPELESAKNVFLVSDRDGAIQTAVSSHFPNLKIFLCRNTLIQDCERWLRNYCESQKEEVSYYTDCVETLLCSESIEIYDNQFLAFTTKWSRPFIQYFIDAVNSVVRQLGAWETRPFGVESAVAFECEDLNFFAKKLKEWIETPVDAVALALYRLAESFNTEIEHGRTGLGDYHLREGVESRGVVHRARVPTRTSFKEIVECILASSKPSASSLGTECKQN